MNLEFRAKDDTFTLSYDPSRIDVDRVMSAIRTLGYRPFVVEPESLEAPRPTSNAQDGRGFPPVIAEAHERAKRRGELLLIDFHASWCAPCRVLEREVFEHPDTRALLASLTLLRVDTDDHSGTANAFDVVGLPTLVVLDLDGREIFRHVGPLPRSQFLEQLQALAPASRDGESKARGTLK